MNTSIFHLRNSIHSEHLHAVAQCRRCHRQKLTRLIVGERVRARDRLHCIVLH